MRTYLFFDKSLMKPLILTIKNLIKNRLKQARTYAVLTSKKYPRLLLPLVNAGLGHIFLRMRKSWLNTALMTLSLIFLLFLLLVSCPYENYCKQVS